MSKISATIVADSINPQGDRLTSLLITFPRILLSEVNTHRMLSKNTSSSRAIPFNKMVEAVQNDPFIPIAWQKEHKGMQGFEYFTTEDGVDIFNLEQRVFGYSLKLLNNYQNLKIKTVLNLENKDDYKWFSTFLLREKFVEDYLYQNIPRFSFQNVRDAYVKYFGM